MSKNDLTCKKHPKYHGKTRPIAECWECWSIWFEKHPNEIITAKDLRRILRAGDVPFAMRLLQFHREYEG